MTKIKKINYGLLFIVFCLLFFVPAQSQTPKISVSLTWSTDTYIPLDYPAKALASRGSIIEVAANINSPEINPQELIYQWFLDDFIQKEDSGQGQQVFQFNIGESITRQHLVKVEIKDKAGSFIASSAYLPLKAHEPEVVLQTNIPSLKSSNLTKKYLMAADQEIEFTATPYFFNIKEIDELDYKWRLGEQETSQIRPANPNFFTLKVGQVAESIKQNLTLWVTNKNNPLQRAETTAEITIIP